MESFIQNEFEDTITKEEMGALIERIRKLNDSSIDELWFRCGFVFEDKEQNKALPKKAIEDILDSYEKAEDLVGMFFLETRLEEIRKALADIERERASKR